MLHLLLSSCSGADVLGGDASSKGDDCGQVRFLPHRPGLKKQDSVSQGKTVVTNRSWVRFYRGPNSISAAAEINQQGR